MIAKVGKTSIIEVLITASFEEEVQPVLPVLVVPKEVTPERVHVSIVDTPGDPDQFDKVEQELKIGDVVVLVYSVNDESSQKRVVTYWLQKFRSMGLSVPIILVGNKIDIRGGITDPMAASKMEAFIKPIMDTYREVDVCIECSAKTVSNISEVFYFAQKAVLHPTAPLYDVDMHALKPAAAAALRRIFKLCDKDRDGGLNDKELNDFQYTCFNVHLQPDELTGVKKVVRENRPKDGIRPDGAISVEGFIFLHTLFVQKGRLETTWIVLRKFGYDDDMRLSLDDKARVTRSDDQGVELSAKGKQFLSELFANSDKDADGLLSPAEIAAAFADLPDAPFAISGSEPVLGGDRLVPIGPGGKPDHLSLDAFLARWSLYAFESPNDALLALLYLGYLDNIQTALKVTRPRKRDRYNRTVSREVFNVLVLGDCGPVKSDIIRGLAKYSATGRDVPGMASAATLVVDDPNAPGARRTLIMRDARELGIQTIASSKAVLDTADIACIVYDATKDGSFDYAQQVWKQVQAVTLDAKIPVVFVAALDNMDGDGDGRLVKEGDTLCANASLPPPVRLSMKDREDGNLYQDLLGVALHPEVACPGYYGASSSRAPSTTTILQVTAGTIVISGLLYAAKRLYDYYSSKPTTTN